MKRMGKKNDKHMFLRIWLRAGIPILAAMVVVLYILLYFALISIEMINGSRVERISVEMAYRLSNTDMTDKTAIEEQLDSLSDFDMVGILFDRDGSEIARSDADRYMDAGEELIAQYHELEETILEIYTGNDRIRKNQVYAFAPNYWYAESPVWTPQGEYVLYCAGVSSLWQERGGRLVPMGMGIFAAVVILTLCIAWSYYNLYKKQQAMEAAYSQKVNALAHSLKTPMMVISGYSENFLAEIEVEKRMHYAEKILENVNRMNAVVEEILEFTN